MKTLSLKQQKIIKYIGRFIRENSYPPTVRDIQGGCRISSTSVVDYNLNILERTGYIRRHAEISRGIELLSKKDAAGATLQVPVIGTIAAGQPIPVPSAEAWSNATSEILDVPAELARNREGIYALRIKGLSMVDALINDNDIVLMQHVSAVENGEMAAVWLKAEKEATLKKVYVEKGRVRLQPANSQMQPIYAKPDNVEIQGKVIAVFRRVA